MLESLIDQHERKRVLDNDRRVRGQGGSAYIDHYTQEAGGRFSAVASAQVIGQSAIPNYPAASAHQADPCGQEPPLGYSIDAQEPLEHSPHSPAQGNSAAQCLENAPSPLGDVERGTEPQPFRRLR